MPRPLRILYHHRTLGEGAEGVHIREMIGGFRELGHEVLVAALVGEQDARWQNKTSRWGSIKTLIPEWSLELAELVYNPVGRRIVSRAIRTFHPDFLYDRYNLYTTAALDSARRAGVPTILEVNSPIALERSQYEVHPLRFRRLAQRYEQYSFNAADHLIAVSSPLKEYLITQFGVADERITVLPNAANATHFDPTMDNSLIRRRYDLGEKKVIGYVGSLRPWHGLDMLVRAFASLAKKIEQLHLLVVGGGSMSESLSDQVRHLGIEAKVTLTGPVDHQDIRPYLAAMDIGVSPKATFYASPMKILEYMAMRLTTIAPRMRNIEDIVEHEKDALLFEPDDVASLCATLERAIRDEELASRLAEAARRKIDCQLNWKANASSVADRFSDLFETRTPRDPQWATPART